MELNKKHIINFIKKKYPNYEKIKEISDGFSHYVFEIKTKKKELILKASEERLDKFSLRKETRIHKLMKRLNIPTAQVIKNGFHKGNPSFEYIIISKINGIRLDKALKRMNEREKEETMQKVGELLGKIHKTKFKVYGYLDIKGINEDVKFSLKKTGKGMKLNPAKSMAMSLIFHDFGKLISYKKINEKTIINILKYLIKNQDLTISKEKPSLIHGDYEPKNIFVKKIKNQWKIIGLIDFEYSASMTKEYDFLKLKREGFLKDEKTRKNILKGYKKFQKIPRNFEKKVKYFQISRDLGFLTVLYKAGNFKKAEEILKNIKKEIK